jgi:phosphohistidine phosphatase SixA
MIIASPSKRTKETALLMSREFNVSNVDFVDNLYNRLHHADARDSLKILLDLIRQTPEATKVLMLVGHNDDILPVAKHLTDE